MGYLYNVYTTAKTRRPNSHYQEQATVADKERRRATLSLVESSTAFIYVVESLFRSGL